MKRTALHNRLSPLPMALTYLFLTLVFLTMIIPMLNALALSFSTRLGSMSPGIRLLPDRFTLDGYVEIFSQMNLARPLGNSVFTSVLSTALEIFLASLSGYVLIQHDLPFKKAVTSVILITMMVPGDLTLISTYSLNKSMHLLNSYTGLIINGLISGFSILVIRNYYLSVPVSLAESARIDGAGEFKIYRGIYLPLSIPGIAAVTFLEFVGKWNSLMLPVTLITDAQKFTLPVVLRSMVFNNSSVSGTTFVGPNAVMAATVISVLPLVVVYAFAQRFLMSGLNVGAVKE